MIKVWILLMIFAGDPRSARSMNVNGPVIIDNIATKAECERVGNYLMSTSGEEFTKHVCVEAWKAVRP